MLTNDTINCVHMSYLCYSDLTGFYAYEGSLTYPECNDGIVQWIVMETPLYVRRNGLVSIDQNIFPLHSCQ